MVLVPKGRPVLGPFNTFYLRMEKLVEHCQGEIGAGCIRVRSPQVEGAVYFDPHEIVESCIQTPEGTSYGQPALTELLEEAGRHSLVVDVVPLEPTQVHFWGSLVSFQPLYAGLSAEFTDLRGLVKKMGAEKLTGFIEVCTANGAGDALLLFDEGQVVGGSYASAMGSENDTPTLGRLVDACSEGGGTFTVCRAVPKGSSASTDSVETPRNRGDLADAAERALRALENAVGAKKSLSTAFSTLLRAKFLGKAGKYEFLDPFAGELEYADGRLRYEGETDLRVVASAVGECVNELANELGLLDSLQDRLREEFSRSPRALAALGLVT